MNYLQSLSLHRFSFFIIIFILLCGSSPSYAQLSGDILVGSGETYPTIASAVNALNTNGFTGHLRFIIKDGTYNEQVEINEFANSDENNTITFTSQSGDSTDVIFAHESGSENNYIIRLNGTDYITIENITLWGVSNQYTHGIDITGTAQNITIQNCELRSNAPVLQGAQNPALIHHDRANITDVTISNNYLVGGMGVYFKSLFSAPTQGVKILNNTFEDGNGGVFLEYQNAPVIDKNIMINKDRVGCKLVNCDGELEITNNKIEVLQTSAISLTYCDGGVPPFGESGLIANNFLTSGSKDNTEAKGIFLNQCSYQDVYHNSVNIIGPNHLYARAFELTGGSNNTIMNNIFANQHDGYACYITSPGANTELDYNTYYSPANFPYFWNANYTTLTDYQTASGLDAHSQEVYPGFTSDTDLHTLAPWLNNKGDYISDLPVDIDGISRSDPPDVGAAEFTPLAGTTTPLNGTYDIGSNPYYSFSDAIDDLLIKGVSGPVVFNIASAQYNEQLIIQDIPGASDVNTITFRSLSGDPDDVVLYFYDSDIDNNYVVLMKGADNWRFENMTFRSNTSPVTTYGRVIHLFAGTEDFNLNNCRLIGSPVNNSAAEELAVLYSYRSVYTSRVFENNLFQHGGRSFVDKGYHNLPLLEGLELVSNEFKEAYYAVVLDYHDSPKIIGNIIHETDRSGIHVAHAEGTIEVSKNQVTVDAASGLYLESCDGSPGRGFVANNFFHSGGDAGAYGMNVYNSLNFDFYHNSVSVTSTDASNGRALYLSVSQNLNFINNIFANSGGGLVYHVDTPSAFSSSDYNNLYTSGAVLANWNAVDQADLAALRSTSGMETNSVSVNPQFVSTSDLHTSAAGLDGAAQHLAAVPFDIDGQPRHPSTPDIGADEFMSGPNNPPTVTAPIADELYAEDSGPHTTVADLNTVFTDPDSGDYLTFTASSDNQDISATITSPALIIDSQENYFGPAHIFVTATDFAGNAVSDTFIVGILPVNDPPVAVDDDVSSGANNLFTVRVLENDYDVDRDAITITAATNGDHGTTSISPSNTRIYYTPDNGFFGLDSFTYDISDGHGGTDQAVVKVTITNLFEAVELYLPDISHGLGIWGDYDQDGDLDILLAGTDGSSTKHLRVYRNTDGHFSLLVNLPGILPGTGNAGAWGDYDNDGDPDFLITGFDNSSVKVSKIYRNDLYTFTEITTELPGVSDGAVDWGDYDNDGDLDILLTGLNASNNESAEIYRNDGPGEENTWNFNQINTSLPGIQKGSAVWGDYDNDGDLDILISGHLAGRIAEVFRNDENTFTDIDAGLAQIAGDADWIDYDSDGDLDISINGTNASLDAQCDIYRNTNGVFTNIYAGLTGLKNGTASWGDYDNDGDPDLCLTGTTDQNVPSTLIYDNINGNIFIEGSIALPGVVFSATSWGDFDNDMKLDILITGYQYEEPNVFTALYKNYLPNANTPPTAPELLTAQVADSSVSLHWNLADDGQTSSPGLSYNLRIGELEDGSQIMSAMSNPDGFRQVAEMGNVCMDTSWTISGLTPGRLYYYSVQAVDAAYAGSEFSSGIFTTISPYIEELFTDIPGMINAEIAWGDYDDDGDLDFVMAGNQDESITCEFYSNDDGVFTSVNHIFPNANQGILEWIDYDNDGDLDLFYAGAPQDIGKFARVYRNDNGTFTNIEADFGPLSSANSVYAADWGDYDNDGDPDLVISGHYNNPITKVFINTNGIFSDANLDLAGVATGMISWIDYDVDGDLDLFITGNPQIAGIHSYLYNNDNGSFSLRSTNIIGAYWGSVDWADYDSDGDPDLLLTGLSELGELLMPMTRVFRNDDPVNADFTDMNMGLPGIRKGRATWGDFNNDGDLDILMAGNRSSGVDNTPYSAIYINNSGNFSKLDIYLPPTMEANALWADFDNDRDLDFMISGSDENAQYYSKLFRNKTETVNNRPSNPAGLIAEASDNTLVFTWNSSQDNETAAAGLGYNLRVGTTPGGSEILSAMADTSGYRKIVKQGNIGQRTTFTLNNYEPDLFYYWTVQAIDNSFVGSAFTSEHSFYQIGELENLLVVTNNNDSGEGSLRQCMLDANERVGLDTIIFAANVRGSIELQSPAPSINESVSILGPGANLLSIDGNQHGQMFWTSGQTNLSLHLEGLTIEGGSTSNMGAGISMRGDTLYISDCRIRNNVSSSSGGGVTNLNGSTAIYNTTIENNQSSGGSGILIQSGNLFVFGSTISDNTTNENPGNGGAGIFTTGDTEIINSTISGNQHPNDGGGIYIAGTISVSLKYVTITDNTANIGGGIFGNGAVAQIEVSQSIIAENIAQTSSPDFSGRLISEGYNLIQNTDGTVITGDTTGNILGLDPMLGSLVNNGGETPTHLLLAGSPAIDAGKPGAGIPNDQRGIQRPQDGNGDEISRRDIGSVEVMQDEDNDGMPDVEEWGPNEDDMAYDGNGDLIPDAEQDDVSSFFGINRSTYITLQDLIGFPLKGVRIVEFPDEDEDGGDSGSGLPPYCFPIENGYVCYPNGWYSWGISSRAKSKTGQNDHKTAALSTSCRLYLEEGSQPENYMMYGPTPKIPYDHFYDFAYDGKTGAVISGDTVTLYFIDGQRGDGDLTANGEIKVSPGSYGVISTGICNEKELIPETYALLQNYPNPFNPVTIIPYHLPKQSRVKLTVFNTLGQKVVTLIDGNVPAGRHTFTWQATNLASGVYFYRLEVEGFIKTRKLVYLK